MNAAVKRLHCWGHGKRHPFCWATQPTEDTMEELFNVVQFFEDDTQEYVRRGVGPEEAVRAAEHYTQSVAAKLGFVNRVIITDQLDCCCFEWLADKGITWPPRGQ